MNNNEHILGKNLWQLILVKGIIAILFGILILVWPKATLASIIVVIAAFITLSGIFSLISGILDSYHGKSSGSLDIIIGVLALILGTAIFKSPGASFVTYVMLIGIWFIIRGIYEIIMPKPQDRSKTLVILMGVLSIIVGIMLLNKPVINGVVLYWALGLYALIYGPLLIAYAFVLKNKFEKIG